MSNNRITPFVKRMRTNGGTIYTFSSAVEDIGLNINERNNVVKISHFALLDIPSIQQLPSTPTNIEVNKFNITNIVGAFEYEQGAPSTKDGRVLIAESFQNYALNLESNLLNQDDYNAILTRTVTERVFWKWLKETGAVRFDKDLSVGNTQYWGEELDADGSLGYNRVVKYVGPVSAGNVRSDSFGTYNETYVLVPTSHGQTDAYFQIIEDDNYRHGMEIGDLGEKILGRESYTLPHPDGLSYNAYYDYVDSSIVVDANGVAWDMTYDNSSGVYSPGWWYTAEGVEPTSFDNAYLTDSSSYMDTGIYHTDLEYDDGGSSVQFRRSKVDCLNLVLDLDRLKGIYADSALTYDKMAIQYSINDAFNFNAVLIYYTVYNSTMDEVLGRNLLGVLFIDAPSGNSAEIDSVGITIPSLEKIQSQAGGFGTSYNLRLNIKTDNMVDDTGATIVDESTSDQVDAANWVEAFANLNTAVNILTQNNSTINFLSGQYIEVQETQTQILNDLEALQWQVNDISRDINGEANTIAMFANGDDPLVESSIYMRFGKVGIQKQEPEYPLHIGGTTKTDEIIIENAIRDTSNNILLGYGSPLQVGASTNDREIHMYVGNLDPIIIIDSSFMKINTEVSIGGNLYVDGSALIAGTLLVENISSPNFDFGTSYIRDTSNGATLEWVNGFLEVNVSSDVSAAGNEGSIQYANNAGGLDANDSLHWDISNGRLGVQTNSPNYTVDVSGIINVQGDFYQNGLPFSAGAGGDVAWAGGTYTPNNGIITSAGDGSIVSETNLTFNGTNLILGNNADHTFGITGGSGRQLTIEAGDHTTGGTGGALRLYGGDTTGSTGGLVQVRGGSGSGTGGSVSINGASCIGTGGNVTINAGSGTGGPDGRIYLGSADTQGIYLSTTSIPTGTPITNEVLFIDTGSSNQLKRGTVSGGGVVTSYTNGASNRVITGTSATGITGESTLLFSSNTLSAGTADTPLIIAASGTTNGGDLTLLSGGGSSTSGEIRIYPGTSAGTRGSIYLGGDNIGTYYASNLHFYAGHPTYERMQITSAGKVRINNGATTAASETAQLTIMSDDVVASSTSLNTGSLWGLDVRQTGTSSGSGTGIKFTNGNTSAYTGTAAIVGNDTGSYGQGELLFGVKTTTTTGGATMPVLHGLSGTNLRGSWYNASGSERIRFNLSTGQIDADGDIIAYSTLISDKRLKEDIKTLENSLDKVLKLRGVSYIRKSKGEKHLGFVAQEVESIIPEVISETPLPLETGDEETLYKTINYSEIIPHLVEAIKEQQNQIEELKEEIKNLKK